MSNDQGGSTARGALHGTSDGKGSIGAGAYPSVRCRFVAAGPRLLVERPPARMTLVQKPGKLASIVTPRQPPRITQGKTR